MMEGESTVKQELSLLTLIWLHGVFIGFMLAVVLP